VSTFGGCYRFRSPKCLIKAANSLFIWRMAGWQADYSAVCADNLGTIGF